MFSVQSDCPHREKLGYGGDIVAASEMALLNLDMARFYAKTVRDFADAQRPNGGFTETAPYVGIGDGGFGDGSGPVGWGLAHPLLLRQLYQYYGDRRLVEEQYDAARRWVELVRSRAEDHTIGFGIGDHESIAKKPTALTGTALYYYNAHLMAQMAEILGRREDATEYGALAETIRFAFNARFLDPKTGRYDAGTQACQAFALYLGLVPDEHREAALARLVEDIEAHDGHLTTGIFGTKYMLDVLTEHGRADVAYRVATQRTHPGWGYMIESGATTLWEAWQADDRVLSHNHPMFGSVSEWLYKALAGIEPDPDAVGFDRVTIRPNVAGDLMWARATYRSIRGPITSSWRVEGDTFSLDVALPPGVIATVYVPTSDASAVTESGLSAEDAEGVELVGEPDGMAAYEVGSGEYQFSSRLR
jgi:alpha-L-rhamnosidase